MTELQAQLRSLLLAPPALTLAVAESLTSGSLQAAIGSQSGASDYFLGGVTAYTIDQKVTLLEVDREEAEKTNAVSEVVAEQMALGACRLFGSGLGLGTTGYAEPCPQRGIQCPQAFWAIAHEQSGEPLVVRSGVLDCPGLARVEVQQAVARHVIDALLTWLHGFRSIS